MKSPSLYEVTVSASKPFILVLAETFNPGWLVHAPWGVVPEEYHFGVNGYANMWYVDHAGEYKLELSFAPNDLLNYGALLSFGVSAIAILVLFRTRVLGIVRRLTRIHPLKSGSPGLKRRLLARKR
jgi:hypothetical protein